MGTRHKPQKLVSNGGILDSRQLGLGKQDIRQAGGVPEVTCSWPQFCQGGRLTPIQNGMKELMPSKNLGMSQQATWGRPRTPLAGSLRQRHQLPPEARLGGDWLLTLASSLFGTLSSIGELPG